MDEIRVLECETEGLVMKHQVELKEGELKKAMEVYKAQNDGLCLELKEAIMSKNAADDELKVCKRKIEGLMQRTNRLEDEKKVVCEREKKGNDGSERYVKQLMKEIWDLQSRKTIAEDGIEVWKKRFKKLETESLLRMKHEVELQEELEVYRTNCNELSLELEEKKKGCVETESKLKGLILKKIDVDYELNKYKKLCKGLEERISRLDDDRKVICEREKKEQQRIAYLEMEIKNKENGEREKYVELITENRDLECGKRRAEDEVNDWKKRFEELKGMMLSRIAADDELKEYKTMCNGLKERIMGLEEDQKVMCDKEKRAQERITYLENELKTKGSDEREKCVELIKDLECGKRRAVDEVNVWRKRSMEFETQALRLKEVELEKGELDKEVRAYRTKCHGLALMLEEYKMDCVATKGKLKDILLRKVGVDEKLRAYKRSCHELKERIKHKQKKYTSMKLQSEMEGGKDGADLPRFKIKDMTFNSSDFAGCNHISSLQRNGGAQVTGPASIILQSKPIINVKEEKNTPLKPKVDLGSRVRKDLDFELKRSSTEKLALLEQGSVRKASGGIVDINNCDGKKGITPKHTCNIRSKEMVYVSTDLTWKRSLDSEMDLTSKKCFKRPYSDLRGEEYWSSCEEGIPLASIPKRRTSKTLTSENESDGDEGTSIGKLMMKRQKEQNEGIHRSSPTNLCTGKNVSSSGGQDIEESITPSRQRLISLRQCEEKKNWGEKTSRNEETSSNHLQMSSILYHNVRNPTSENGKQNVLEDIDLHNDGGSLGEVSVKCSDSSYSGDSSSDSEVAMDIDLSFNQVLAMIKRNRVNESKWKFEADMLSSFELDSELCMKAVCALYRQQISDEKMMKGSNNRGFNKYDALRGTTLAEFLTDGDRKGNLKKSVKELQMFDSEALEECKRLAKHYSEQLFNIYQNREDPFFLPSGV